RFASTPERMAMIAAIVGALAASGGLFASLEFDTPSGPSIVVAALILFLASLTWRMVEPERLKAEEVTGTE
ncbi:metal ABC transporter permease, partial [Rhodoplanes roseus]